MGKRDAHRQDLFTLFDGLATTGDRDALTTYLLSNSNLPGRRGNLELALAFGDVVGERADQGMWQEPLWTLCSNLAKIPAAEAPVNDPHEFLPFCGTVGLGAMGAACAERFEPALGALRKLARDPRWRMREAVCFGLQRLLAVRSTATLAALEDWVAGGQPLEMRAVAGGVAEPALLQDSKTALAALQLHRGILSQVLDIDDRRSDLFRTLRQGLAYTLSVIVCAVPNEGFAFLEELAQIDDRDVRWIVKENLKKNRLIRAFPSEVEVVQALLI